MEAAKAINLESEGDCKIAVGRSLSVKHGCKDKMTLEYKEKGSKLQPKKMELYIDPGMTAVCYVPTQVHFLLSLSTLYPFFVQLFHTLSP